MCRGNGTIQWRWLPLFTGSCAHMWIEIDWSAIDINHPCVKSRYARFATLRLSGKKRVINRQRNLGDRSRKNCFQSGNKWVASGWPDFDDIDRTMAGGIAQRSDLKCGRFAEKNLTNDQPKSAYTESVSSRLTSFCNSRFAVLLPLKMTFPPSYGERHTEFMTRVLPRFVCDPTCAVHPFVYSECKN